MAFVHGKDSFFSLDNTGGTPTTLSSYIDSIDGLPGEVELADVTALGDEGHKFVPGLENASISISGHWDSTEDAVFGAPSDWKSGTRTFSYGPAGNGSGAVQYTGECYITGYTTSSQVADKVSWSATLQVNGQVTRSTF